MIDKDSMINIFHSVKIMYSSWLSHEIGVTADNHIILRRFVEYIDSSANLMIEARINVNDFHQYEIILIKYTLKKFSWMRHVMSFKRIVQVQLLFKYCECMEKEEKELVFVYWFDIKRAAKDLLYRMYLLRWSIKYIIISVTDIERPVQLISKFGTQIGTSFKMK